MAGDYLYVSHPSRGGLRATVSAAILLTAAVLLVYASTSRSGSPIRTVVSQDSAPLAGPPGTPAAPEKGQPTPLQPGATGEFAPIPIGGALLTQGVGHGHAWRAAAFEKEGKPTVELQFDDGYVTGKSDLSVTAAAPLIEIGKVRDDTLFIVGLVVPNAAQVRLDLNSGSALNLIPRADPATAAWGAKVFYADLPASEVVTSLSAIGNDGTVLGTIPYHGR